MLLGQEFSTDFAKYKTCSLDALLRFDLSVKKFSVKSMTCLRVGYPYKESKSNFQQSLRLILMC